MMRLRLGLVTIFLKVMFWSMDDHPILGGMLIMALIALVVIAAHYNLYVVAIPLFIISLVFKLMFIVYFDMSRSLRHSLKISAYDYKWEEFTKENIA